MIGVSLWVFLASCLTSPASSDRARAQSPPELLWRRALLPASEDEQTACYRHGSSGDARFGREAVFGGYCWPSAAIAPTRRIVLRGGSLCCGASPQPGLTRGRATAILAKESRRADSTATVVRRRIYLRTVESGVSAARPRSGGAGYAPDGAAALRHVARLHPFGLTGPMHNRRACDASTQARFRRSCVCARASRACGEHAAPGCTPRARAPDHGTHEAGT